MLDYYVKNDIGPTDTLVDAAAVVNDIDLFEYCISLGARPSKNGVDIAAMRGNIDIVNKCIDIGIMPKEYYIDELIQYALKAKGRDNKIRNMFGL